MRDCMQRNDVMKYTQYTADNLPEVMRLLLDVNGAGDITACEAICNSVLHIGDYVVLDSRGEVVFYDEVDFKQNFIDMAV